MENCQRIIQNSSLKPLNFITYVVEDNLIELSPEMVKIELVGEKAFGLSCLPKSWTLPFFIISDTFLSKYRDNSGNNQNQLIKYWSKQIIKAALSIGINEQDDIIIRSSGCDEGLDERGKYYSTNGNIHNIHQILEKCLNALSADQDLKKLKIPLIIQKYIIPISAKGHLSNERHCYEEKRDWLGEFEDAKTKVVVPFKINLRNWRKRIIIENYISETLLCNLSPHVSEVLKIPATWAYEKKLRIHFEWIWDGSIIYIVQADQERKRKGINPTRLNHLKSRFSYEFQPRCLKEINMEHARRYNKIENVFTYLKLGLPTTKLYVLDDQSIIENLASGYVSTELKADIQGLVKNSLVIRMDIATEELEKRQLLPRTQEERNLNSALNWIKKQSYEFKNSDIREDIVFIFHNFIPAISSAFAYAAPNERKVQIEALWGLPEGLYYNSHDKYIVDTKTPVIEKLNIDSFEIYEKRNFKQYIVSPDENGKWTSKIIRPPYDWRSSIRERKWIGQIALESRRIAAEESKPLSIMWFIDVTDKRYERKIIPWHHEHYDSAITNRAKAYRTKTPFDKSIVIKTRKDIDVLEQEVLEKRSIIRRVRVQPSEDDLLRDKNTLRKIGELTQKIDAIILLEGGVLSHAYYQLMGTKAIVEISHPFDDFEEKQEFNKLVRDKVSLNIENGGEIVNIARLSGEYLMRALREKLIEEAFEVLDSVDQESIMNEIADVNEVIDGILSHMGINKDMINQRQKVKRDKAGGFKDGIILIKTKNPMPIKKGIEANTLFDRSQLVNNQEQSIDDRMLIELTHKIDKWTDRREHPAANETIMRLVIPMVKDNWIANTFEKDMDLNENEDVKITIKGKRIGSKYQIELSIFNKQKQLKLFQ